MEWASRHPCCIHDLIEFEARVNDVWCRHDDVVICVYDLAKFSGDIVMDVLRTHPMIIVGGILQQNPFYMQPQEFLQELHQRRAKQALSPRAAG
jgi:MEDS: MEthanogen/methylotroph, DcmR Sensory domain